MDRIQNKNRRIRTHEISKISLSCFDDKTYILDNGTDDLAFGFCNYNLEKYMSKFILIFGPIRTGFLSKLLI